VIDVTSNDQLNRSTPEEQGVLSEGILAFIEALEKSKSNVHSFMLLRHAHVIAEGWWSPYEAEHKRFVYSVSKSFTSTAIGFAVTEGLLNVDDKVISFFPDEVPEEIDENLAIMRVKDLLTMTTGHAVDTILSILDPNDDSWVKTILSLPVYYTPGTQFLYNTGATYLLSALVQKVSGQTMLEYLKQRLFEPLCITDVTWDSCPQGITAGGWGLSIKTEDLAKFGLLYQQKGIWNGKMLLPSEWVEEVSAPWARNDTAERANEPIDWRQGYGYQFWQCRHGAYRADGAKGQFCIVMPDQDAVIVLTSETDNDQHILDLIWKHLLPAMKDKPVPMDTAMHNQLRNKLSTLELVSPGLNLYPKVASISSGKRFHLDDNELNIHSVSFQFDGNSCSFQLWDNCEEHKVVCGNGEWVKSETMMPGIYLSLTQLIFNKKVNKPTKIAAKGNWIDENTFVMRWQFLETAHNETITCSFQGDLLTLEFLSSFATPNDPIFKVKERQYRGRL
jgi:CubicO group peptidase (beta-lactamase class C family)